MNRKLTEKQDTLATLKTLVARRGVEAPSVTTDSGLERRWFPSFIVAK